MNWRSKRNAVLLGTALTLPMSAGTAATNIDLNRDVVNGLMEECQTLASEIRDRNNRVPDGMADTVVSALNADEAAACTTAQEELAAAPMPNRGDRTGQSETARDQETAEMRETVEVTEQATIEGEAAVIVPEPQVDVAVDAPKVTVRKSSPDVSVQEQASTIQVEQPQPTVDVEIPEIVVRVEVPAPRIYIESSDPSVDVASANPQVDVQQSEPRVTVRQPEPRLKVDLGVDPDADTDDAQQQTADAGESDGEMNRGGEVQVSANEPQVEFVEPENQPNISVSSAEPNVQFTGSEPNISVRFAQDPTVEVAQTGEPQVTFETAEEREARMQNEGAEAQGGDNRQAQADAQSGQDAQPAEDRQMILVSQLLGMEVISEDGEDLGEPEAVIERDGQVIVVIEEGGFLGLGENRVGVPLERIAMNMEEEELRLQSMTEQQIEDAGNFDYDMSSELPGDREVRIN